MVVNTNHDEHRLSSIEQDIARLDQRLTTHEAWAEVKFEKWTSTTTTTSTQMEAHERSCQSFRKIIFISITVAASLFASIFGGYLYVLGRQEIVITRLNAHNERINSLSDVLIARENVLRNDIRELRDDLKKHDTR